MARISFDIKDRSLSGPVIICPAPAGNPVFYISFRRVTNGTGIPSCFNILCVGFDLYIIVISNIDAETVPACLTAGRRDCSAANGNATRRTVVTWSINTVAVRVAARRLTADRLNRSAADRNTSSHSTDAAAAHA